MYTYNIADIFNASTLKLSEITHQFICLFLSLAWLQPVLSSLHPSYILGNNKCIPPSTPPLVYMTFTIRGPHWILDCGLETSGQRQYS